MVNSRGEQSLDFRNRHDEVSKNISSIMMNIILFGTYCLITLSITDKTLFENRWRIKLPIFNAEVEMQHFMLAGPLMLLVLFLYLHTFLQHKMRIEQLIQKDYNFDSIDKLPTIFNMEQKLTKFATSILFYWLTPMLLVYFSVRALKMGSFVFIAVGAVATISISTILWNFFSQHAIAEKTRRFHLILIPLVYIVIPSITLAIITNYAKPEYRWNLSRVNLTGENMYGRDLSTIDLTKSVLNDANLKRADLSGSRLIGASLENTILTEAIMKGTMLRETYLDGANLERARLHEADLTGASLKKINANEADFGLNAKLENAKFDGAQLSGAGLKMARLHGATLRGDLSWAIMDEADLSYADVLGAKMVGTKLKGANLKNITLERANLMMAELMEANLTKAGLHRALLHGANLENAILVGANLSNAKFSEIDADKFPWESHKYGDDKYLFPVIQFHGPVGPANVSGADFTDANLEKAAIQGVNFESSKGLKADQLKKATGNKSTRLPEYLREFEESIRAAWLNI